MFRLLDSDCLLADRTGTHAKPSEAEVCRTLKLLCIFLESTHKLMKWVDVSMFCKKNKRLFFLQNWP